MRFSRFFIDRPIFASVISTLILLIGAISYLGLPVSQYPAIVPPSVQITATYPGASAETIADTVATPIEQEVNGVEGMLYMTSQSTADGALSITVTFETGTDVDTAQVLVQNRVSRAEPRLPEVVRNLGVVTEKSSPDFLMVIHMVSPDDVYDQLYISNYASLQVKDEVSRVEGVAKVRVVGARDYSMRIWIDTERAAELDLTASEIVAALREQNIQVASGTVNQAPVPTKNAFELSVQTQGRLTAPEQFENIVLRGSANGQGGVIRVRDIARAELGAESYSTNAYMDEQPAVAMPVLQLPGSNALETADNVLALMERLSADFPEGLEYRVIYNPTAFVADSVDKVYTTLLEATLLVVLVIFLFLQSLRASIIPVLAIPISLIGTFFVMQIFGFSLNNLSLFGLVLAIGIVVDDAIVVVENIERQIENGLSPQEAAYASMDEVSGALVATALVLLAVFVPTAFVAGITGAFYQQFAVTIATATVISTLVSLTLSPAMARLLLKPKDETGDVAGWQKPTRKFFDAFNAGFERLTVLYGDVVSRIVRSAGIVMLIFVGFLVLTGVQFARVPAGFIPDQDQGYLISAVTLPQGAALERTDEVIRKMGDVALADPAVSHVAQFAGFNGANFTSASNAGGMFIILEEFSKRDNYKVVQQRLNKAMAKSIEAGRVLVIVPPPVRGVGNGSGFKMMVQDRAGMGLPALQKAAKDLMLAANKDPMLENTFTLFEVSTPQVFLDIDRQKAELMGVPVGNIFDALEIYLGSAFINDFNYLGRTFQVTAQADARFRDDLNDLNLYYTRNQLGQMVPLGTLAEARNITGPSRVQHYNLFPAAAVQGQAADGISSGEALARMEELAADILPQGMDFEWTELAYQQKQTGNTAGLIFALSVVFVFLVLAAQYESLTLPLAVILIVPMTILFGITGTSLAGLSNNILTQIGFIVLIALAAKNAILIVEFARQIEDKGKTRFQAAVDASRLRIRPILMTSLAFILGVLPLVLAEGAGAEMRVSLGVVVFSGMLGVTFFGLLLTPVFYVLARWPHRQKEKPPTAVIPKTTEDPVS